MVELKGVYTKANIYTQKKDKIVFDQIRRLCNQPCMADRKICVMPDVHLGNGVTVGVTAECGSQVIPSLLGRDIGCGVLTAKLDAKEVDVRKLDQVVRELQVPLADADWIPELHCDVAIDWLAKREFGTLGYGNHFMELDYSEDGSLYFMIHSGSRGVGRAVADWYQKLAKQELSFHDQHHRAKSLLPLNEERTISYLHDVIQLQRYAAGNRQAMLERICQQMNWNVSFSLETVHNYYDPEQKLLRKGAVSAKKNELLMIPLNMRDGALLCRGKGNEEWNQSVCHGCGRLMSRSVAKKTIRLEDYQQSMNGIYTTSVCEETLDEAPNCYKPVDEIREAITESVDIIQHLRPLYNYKNKERKF